MSASPVGEAAVFSAYKYSSVRRKTQDRIYMALIQSEKNGEIWYDDMDSRQNKKYRIKYKTEGIAIW